MHELNKMLNKYLAPKAPRRRSDYTRGVQRRRWGWRVVEAGHLRGKRLRALLGTPFCIEQVHLCERDYCWDVWHIETDGTTRLIAPSDVLNSADEARLETQRAEGRLQALGAFLALFG